jgi:hypothetical protein|tara:strand:+ start:386 stop:781 length:396 start_codon:yes stop_codon:yes gene_type:complete
MAKVKKSFVTPKWVEIKEMYEKGTNGSDKYGTNFEIKGELDIISSEFVDILGELTRQFGWGCVIEDIKMDLWKERIWSLIENAGLLPEIAWRDDLAKDEEIAAKKLEEDEDTYDFNEYEPTDEELIENENY